MGPSDIEYIMDLVKGELAPLKDRIGVMELHAQIAEMEKPLAGMARPATEGVEGQPPDVATSPPQADVGEAPATDIHDCAAWRRDDIAAWKRYASALRSEITERNKGEASANITWHEAVAQLHERNAEVDSLRAQLAEAQRGQFETLAEKPSGVIAVTDEQIKYIAGRIRSFELPENFIPIIRNWLATIGVRRAVEIEAFTENEPGTWVKRPVTILEEPK